MSNPGFVPRLRHEEAAPSRYNHGVEPAMATRGGRRPRFEPSMATRGRRPPQHANSEQGAGRPRITTPSQNHKKARGWHTNRGSWRAILVSHLAISCRDPKRFGPAIATRGGCRPQPESNQRRKTGSQAVFRTDEYLTQGLDTTA